VRKGSVQVRKYMKKHTNMYTCILKVVAIDEEEKQYLFDSVLNVLKYDSTLKW
jgi:hypothetical protein